MRIIIFVLLVLSVACNRGGGDQLPGDLVRNPKSAVESGSEKKLAAITFENDTHDFGRIIQGEKISYAFKYTNTGNADLIISKVSASCGCTVPTYTREPVKPGGTGVISVAFDSNNRKGFQHKTITVMTNTIPNTTVLNIKAMVVTP